VTVTTIPTAVGSEKAAAVLKVAGPPGEESQSARQVALSGLLRERRPNTVRGWVHAYEEEGIDGFVIEDGRVHDSRRDAFSPAGEEEMCDRLRERTNRSPRSLGLERSRWTLGLLRPRLGERGPETDSGTWHMLDRLGISPKGGYPTGCADILHRNPCNLRRQSPGGSRVFGRYPFEVRVNRCTESKGAC